MPGHGIRLADDVEIISVFAVSVSPSRGDRTSRRIITTSRPSTFLRNTRRGHAGHVLRRIVPRPRPSNPHLAGPDPDNGADEAPSGSSRPARSTVDSDITHSLCSPGRGTRGRPGHHDGGSQGVAHRVLPDDLRPSTRCGSARATSVHRAVRRDGHPVRHLRRSGCRVCKESGWLEILGAGMVDPSVFGFVGTIPRRSRLRFGMGIERIAMLRHGISDIRLLFENDIRFLSQF